jgi:hypothetical protein
VTKKLSNKGSWLKPWYSGVLSVSLFACGHEVNTIIDSGSSSNFISRRFLESISPPLPESDGERKSVGINGFPLTCTKYVKVPVLFGGEFVSTVHCGVLENNVCDLLLGNSFLFNHDARID